MNPYPGSCTQLAPKGDRDTTTSINVVANDIDREDEPITIQSTTQPAHGIVTLTGGVEGARTGLTYTPTADYCNDPSGSSADTFTYTVNGGNTAVVSVRVACVDDPPTAVRDETTMAEDSEPIRIPVLLDDTDVDGGPRSVASVSAARHGTTGLVSVAGGGATEVTYDPAPDYCNEPPGGELDSFTYTLVGGSSAVVSVRVDCVDDLPRPTADLVAIGEDSGAVEIDVLANDVDPDGGPDELTRVAQPVHGNVRIAGDGRSVSYVPDRDYCNDGPGGAPDTFGYLVDGAVWGEVRVTVDCVGELGAETPEELAEVIEDAINGGTDSKNLEGGRTAYYDAESNTLVIVDPSSPDGGTVFKPGAGQSYYDNLR